MKRLITFISLIVIIFVGYVFIKKGFDNKAFPIASYNTIETKHEALTTKLASYDRINQDQYENAKSTLDSSIKTYKNAKTKYETILAELEDVLNKEPESEESEEPVENVIYSDQKVFKIDYLLVVLGNYAKSEGVDMDIELASSSVTDSTASMLEYFTADLNFTVTGEYINVTTFIEYLEKDSYFEWEINDFSMTSAGSGVTAEFSVKNIPIDSESYIATKTSSNVDEAASDGTATDGTTDGTDNTTVDGNTVSNDVDTNSTDNTVSDTTSNTVSNTVSNDTIN